MLALASRERERSGRVAIFVSTCSREVRVTIGGGAIPIVEPAEPDEGVKVPAAGAVEPDERAALRGLLGCPPDEEVLDSDSESPLAACERIIR